MAKKVDGVVRVALVGSGGISAAHGKGFIKHADKIKVVALCDVAQENLDKRSEQLKDVGGASARKFKAWKAMLKEMAVEVAAVDISLRHHLHAPCILDAPPPGNHTPAERR